jgi:RNA polymerase primary sigma factor
LAEGRFCDGRPFAAGAGAAERRLTAAEEAELARRSWAGDAEARVRLVEGFLGLAVSAAQAYAGRGIPLEDLVQEGCLGLLEAARRFDCLKGCRFSTYAVYWARQAILKAFGREAPRLEGRELAVLDGLPGAFSERADFLPLSARAADEGFAPPEEAALERLEAEALRKALAALPERERLVLEVRYGLAGRPPGTVGEAARLLGVSRTRAHQLERQALERLRRLLGAGAKRGGGKEDARGMVRLECSRGRKGFRAEGRPCERGFGNPEPLRA